MDQRSQTTRHQTAQKARPSSALSCLVIALGIAACGSFEDTYAEHFGGYTSAEFQDCVTGPGAEFSGLMRGPDAAAGYCECTLEQLSEQFSLSERRVLATDSIIASRGVMGLTDPAYAQWLSANLRIQSSCTAAILENKEVS